MPRKQTQPQQLRLPLFPHPVPPLRPQPVQAQTPPSPLMYALAELLRHGLQHQPAPAVSRGGPDDAS